MTDAAMATSVAAVLRLIGAPAQTADGAVFYASVQPVFYEKVPTGSALGIEAGRARRYTLYAEVSPAALAVCAQDILLWQGQEHLVQRIETVWLGDSAAYRKASLVLAVGYAEPKGGVV